jgi:hypothetical protein
MLCCSCCSICTASEAKLVVKLQYSSVRSSACPPAPACSVAALLQLMHALLQVCYCQKQRLPASDHMLRCRCCMLCCSSVAASARKMSPYVALYHCLLLLLFTTDLYCCSLLPFFTTSLYYCFYYCYSIRLITITLFFVSCRLCRSLSMLRF